MNNSLKWHQIVVLGSVILFAGCGGSGGSGSSSGGGSTFSSSQAEITTDNQDELAKAAAEGASQAVVVDSAPASPLGVEIIPLSDVLQQVAEVSFAIVKSDFPTGIAIEGVCTTGSVDYTPSSQNIILTYSDCLLEGSEVTVDGTATIVSSTDSFTITYSNFTVSGPELNEVTLNDTTLTCTGVGTEAMSCSYSSDFTGVSGTYRVSNISVSGDATDGYTVSARVSTTNIGYIEITTTEPITFNCENGLPGSGSLTITGSGGNSASVTFDSCTSFTVTLNEVGTTFDW